MGVVMEGFLEKATLSKPQVSGRGRKGSGNTQQGIVQFRLMGPKRERWLGWPEKKLY